MVDLEGTVAAAVKAGALVRYTVQLEQGELEQRRLWIRPEIRSLLNGQQLDATQTEVVKAALRRFVVGGRFSVVTAASKHREVNALGDIKELKGGRPPFIELRFKPPKHDLRLFGRFIRADSLILTTYGMKSLVGKTGAAKLSVANERNRCDAALAAANLKLESVPERIRDSISNATFFPDASVPAK